MNDPLDTKVDDIDVSYPVIPAGLYTLGIKSAEVKPSKKGGQNLVVQFETKEATQSVKGEQVAAGFVLTNNVGLTPTEKYSAIDIGKRIASICQSAQLLGVSPRDIINDPKKLVGRTVLAKVQVSAERTDKETGSVYPERSEIASFVTKR